LKGNQTPATQRGYVLYIRYIIFNPQRKMIRHYIKTAIRFLGRNRLYTLINALGLSISALFSLMIAAFGLLGLTLFVVRSRTNEIGIQKVFGSSEQSIVCSFLRSNFFLVLAASLLSVPALRYEQGG
jgi:hypothetical protein